MASIHEEMRAHCPRCDEDLDFIIKMCYVDYNGVTPCYKCPKCGVIVPASSFNEFLKDGRIRIYV